MTKPLFLKLKTKPYPKHQYMDRDSILWLENNLSIFYSIEELKYRFRKYPINKLNLNLYNNNCFSIHGVRHQIRVSIYIWILCQYYSIKIEEKDVLDLLQSSLYHDILRISDNDDKCHGKKSSEWIEKRFPNINKDIINAIANHNIIMKNYNIYDILIKTADALDRYRLPKEKWWIKKEYLLMPIDDEILEICKFITIYIEKRTYNILNLNELIEEIKKCLKEMTLI